MSVMLQSVRLLLCSVSVSTFGLCWCGGTMALGLLFSAMPHNGAEQVVMSRTFGNASPEGGIGVRMCVPLIDMLNHAGDEAANGLLSTGDVTAGDNVRWDVVSPDNSASGAWEMVLTATKPIRDGEPLLLSYREGPNEEFMLNYGFVPPSNPHDTVQLFDGLSEALEHFWQQELSQVRLLCCAQCQTAAHTSALSHCTIVVAGLPAHCAQCVAVLLLIPALHAH
jgi:hypothetical protein